MIATDFDRAGEPLAVVGRDLSDELFRRKQDVILEIKVEAAAIPPSTLPRP